MGKEIGQSCVMVMLWLKSGAEKYRAKMVALLLCECWQECLSANHHKRRLHFQ